ncbi:hypothetical protein L2E82_39673 [Cichorium intybus]|uniref:Uncharacterized protein n=1 Tax=Cichorium intybus TaxID=13427 RepID=A0ACB9AJU3_CICIN|nr:hypothetical protein L2E82_39673 [Cichorium intybus]
MYKNFKLIWHFRGLNKQPSQSIRVWRTKRSDCIKARQSQRKGEREREKERGGLGFGGFDIQVIKNA